MSYTIRRRAPLFSNEPIDLRASSMLAFDVESSGLNIHTDVPYGFSITDNPDYALYASMNEQWLLDLLADESRPKIAYNAKYDRAMLAKYGVVVDNLIDPMIAAHLLEWESLSLKAISGLYRCEDVMSFTDLKKPAGQMSLEEWADYSCPHARVTFALWKVLEKELKKLALDKPFWNIEMPFLPVLSDIEIAGVAIDTDYLVKLGVEFDKKLAMMGEALDDISGMRGMNHNSADQVAHLLYYVFKLPQGRTTGTGSRPSVDKRYLETIKDKHKYIPLYLAYKELKTLKNSYVTSLLKRVVDGRIYGSLNQTRTRTGRLSSSDPNLQKIPARTKIGQRIRMAFIAPEGYRLVKADWDQLELRDVVHWSGDPIMMAAFLAGRDIHTETAIKLYGDAKYRFKGKTANFKIVYGGGTPYERALLRRTFPRIFVWISEASLQARMDMYVRTQGGRIRTIDDLDPSNPAWMIEHGEREAISTIVQGSSAEEVKKGMRRAWEVTRHTDATPVLQVHDEVVYQAPVGQVNDLIDTLRRTLPSDELSVPLTVSIEVGKNWGEMRKIKSDERWKDDF